MSFFGAAFAAFTMFWEWHVAGLALTAPFLTFAAIGSIATYVIRLSGDGIRPSAMVKRAIIWSSVGEGIGLFMASNIVIMLHRPEFLLPAMALVVGLHFLPIAFAAAFPPFYVLGAVMIAFGFAGLVVRAPAGGEISGVMAAAGLWIAAAIAIGRDWRAKRPAGVGL
ncbi:hypothetical protein [Polymorphobacter sp. PAMC 29334]|uniref:hypothetical protein n=1 Tax=Polymorphobacter sp. PAMC 29334 TaxID=2862331 RepID=UPI001D00445E|nr:hypothetical protein [Polymorphobacter sp. PAMC 29334]